MIIYFYYIQQAKLKSMHEIVLQKRLEQLRRKQRQEAIKVQEELESALTSHGAHHVHPVGQETTVEEVEEEIPEPMVEEYDPSMSPEPMPRLSREDKQSE